MNSKYYCEKCDYEFEDPNECMLHEKECQQERIHTCFKCGKETKYIKDTMLENECWSIYLGRAGYGSGLDGCDVEFDLCDDCLIAFVNSFTKEGQDMVFNSGSNYYLSNEEYDKLHDEV